MKKKILIVEDQFVEANDLQLMLRKAGYEVCGIARSVDIAEEMIKKETPSLVLLDIFLKGKRTGIDLARILREKNIAFIFLSANSNEEVLSVAKTTEPYGFIVKPFREKDLLVTLEIAQYLHEHSIESRARRENELINRLGSVMNGGGAPRERLLQAGRIMQQDIPFDCLFVTFRDAVSIPGNVLSFLRIGFDEYQVAGDKELAQTVRLTSTALNKLLALPKNEKEPIFINQEGFDKMNGTQCLEAELVKVLGMQSLLSFPAAMADEGECVLYFLSRRADAYDATHISLLGHLQKVLVTEARKVPLIKQSTDAASGVPNRFEGIVGNSHLLLNVFDQICDVAPFDTSVLLLGESGTGKEKITDCIHQLSSRKNKPLVKVNCAALPATLIESELFGHEKGSFTGALDKRIGKFEQANGGTLFLDEIGEMPVDLQVKLLRVLQEKEIEPIGGRSSVKIDVRFIAATNRNLEKEVAEGRFRLDLYYRLNVFPIELPSLRERLEDIPVLAQHFINIYNRKSGKKITGVSDTVMRKMLGYHWPGNIRELQHLIERSVLLARGTVIEDIALPNPVKSTMPDANNSNLKTIHENERDHIIKALKQCNGRVWGVGGAAEVLKVPPSTLKSKMKKLGIDKECY